MSIRVSRSRFVRAAPSSPLPRLKVSGTRVVRADDNRTVILRGGDLYASESSGSALNAKEVALVPLLKSQWGCNVLNVTIAAQAVLNNHNHPYGGNYRQMVDNIVQACKANNMYVQLSYRSEYINGAASEGGTPTGTQTVGIPPQSAIDAMGYLAGVYKNENHVIYVAQQETNGSVTWAQARDYYSAVAAAVYSQTMTATEPHKPLVLTSGLLYGRVVDGARTNPCASGVYTGTPDNIVYKSHPYGRETAFNGWFRNAFNAGLPVWIGGWGFPLVDSEPYAMDEADSIALHSWMAANSVPWSTWVFDYPNTFNLITSMNNTTPSSPWGTHTRTEMLKTPANIGDPLS